MALTSDDGDRWPLGDPRSHAQMVQIGGTPLAADCPTYLNQTRADLALCDPAWFRFGGTGHAAVSLRFFDDDHRGDRDRRGVPAALTAGMSTA